jgi:alpha-glucosidase
MDFWTGRRFEGGRSIELPAAPGKPPLLVREGSAIPMNIARQTFDQRGDVRAFAIFAPAEGRFEASCCEDDGESEDWRQGGHGFWNIRVEATGDSLDVALTAQGPSPPDGAASILLRPDDARRIVAPGWRVLAEQAWQGWRRIDLARS